MKICKTMSFYFDNGEGGNSFGHLRQRLILWLRFLFPKKHRWQLNEVFLLIYLCNKCLANRFIVSIKKHSIIKAITKYHGYLIKEEMQDILLVENVYKLRYKNCILFTSFKNHLFSLSIQNGPLAHLDRATVS